MNIRRYLQLLIALLPFGKPFVYRTCFGAKIGERVSIGFGAVLLFDELELRAGTRIAPLTFINARKIFLGVRCAIGRFTQISVHTLRLGPSVTIAPQVSIKGDPADQRSEFSAGAESWVFEFCYINVARPVRLGRNVGVGGGTYVFTHGFWLSQLHGYPVSFGEVTIGDDVWLPWGCFIMPGVEIGGGAVVGARSVVTKNVPPFALVAGTPAKVIKDKANVEVTTEQRVDMLVAAAEEFCAIRKRPLSVERHQDWTVLSIDGARQIAIANNTTANPSDEAVQRLLRVVHNPLNSVGAIEGPLYSTASFQCTPRSSFNGVQSEWLHHLRSMGTRHYPLDEVAVE